MQWKKKNGKDKKAVLNAAQRMLENVDKIGAFRKSSLYEHVQFKNIDESFLRQMKQNLISCLTNVETYDFMREEKTWIELLKKYTEN